MLCAGAIRGLFKRNGIAAAAGLLRVLRDQDPPCPRTVSRQWSASSAVGLLHVQERATKGRTA